MINNVYFCWKIILINPIDIPSKGGVFTLRINLDKDYPNSKPEILILNKIYIVKVFPNEKEFTSLLRI